jgi:hypothetical protein
MPNHNEAEARGAAPLSEAAQVGRDFHGHCGTCGAKTLTAARWVVLRKELGPTLPEPPEPELDVDGYPTADQLQAIRFWGASTRTEQWDSAVLISLLQYVRSLWNYPNAWDEEDVPDDFRDGKFVRRYGISTCGWSGNEDVVDALSENWLFWSRCWVSHRRGGHYVFKVAL